MELWRYFAFSVELLFKNEVVGGDGEVPSPWGAKAPNGGPDRSRKAQIGPDKARYAQIRLDTAF